MIFVPAGNLVSNLENLEKKLKFRKSQNRFLVYLFKEIYLVNQGRVFIFISFILSSWIIKEFHKTTYKI